MSAKGSGSRNSWEKMSTKREGGMHANETSNEMTEHQGLAGRLKDVKGRLEALERHAENLQSRRVVDEETELQEIEARLAALRDMMENDMNTSEEEWEISNEQRERSLETMEEEFVNALNASCVDPAIGVEELKAKLDAVRMPDESSIARLQATIAVLDRVCCEAKGRTERYFAKVERQLQTADDVLEALEQKVDGARRRSGMGEDSNFRQIAAEIDTLSRKSVFREQIIPREELQTIRNALQEEKTSREQNDAKIVTLLQSYADAIQRATEDGQPH